MNKSVISTIVGAAILGLSKSKLGGKNNGKGKIVVIDNGYIRGEDRIIFKRHVPDDVKGIAKEEDMNEFSIPSNLKIIFTVEESEAEFPEYPDIDELEEDIKRDIWDENEEMEDGNQYKENWDSPDDVPEYFYSEYLEEKKKEVEDEHMDQCSAILYESAQYLKEEITYGLENSLKSYSTYFQNCQKYIGDTNIYIDIESYQVDWDEEGYIRLLCSMLVYCGNNPKFAISFIQDLEKFLMQESHFTLDSGPKFMNIDLAPKKSKLRIR